MVYLIMKILLSLIGFNEDFEKKKDGTVVLRPAGFSASIFKDIILQYKFDKHIILLTEDSSGEITNELAKRKYLLKEHINEFHSSLTVEFLSSGIDKSDLQNFPVIESRLRSLIQSIDASDELHVVAGTGPTAFSMAWCTLNLAMKNRFLLHVLQRPEYTPGSRVSTLREIKPFVSELLDDTLREFHIGGKLPVDIFIDEMVKEEYERAHTYAQAVDMHILILGETGCGKDKMAESIYANSPLSNKIYKPINCASLPDEVLYSELFGHVKGAFTGATSDRKGLFEECNGGTLFLDEIGDISPFMQQSLLRVIEKNEIKKLGSNKLQTDIVVRIIAATNVNLYQKCKEGKFRWDLYHRLTPPEIVIQNYRSRNEQQRKRAIAFYLEKLEKIWGRKLNISKDAAALIENYSFPGNFREILNTLKSLYPLKTDIIKPEHLPERFRFYENELNESYETVLKQHCIRMYKKYNYDLAATRKALGYGNSTQLKNKFIEWGVYKEQV